MSILPRLDDVEARRMGYNGVLQKVCTPLGVDCFNDYNYFRGDSDLWSSRDSIHISEDKGIPLIMSLISQGVRSLLEQREEPPKNVAAEQQPTVAHCPNFIWRELRHHKTEGMLICLSLVEG